MCDEREVKVERLLGDPKVQRVIGNDNAELIARRSFVPDKCPVFTKSGTVLQEDLTYSFYIDNEAKKKLPNLINNKVQTVMGIDGSDAAAMKEYSKKKNIGIVFSGGPAPGGHNVIAGLFDAAKKANKENKIFGFIMGPDGIIENDAIEISAELVDAYRNLGGFGMIKTGRTKIDSAEKMALSKKTCQKLGLNAVVIVGGDDSNTNAAFLAQELSSAGIQVLGVPKTIDGDIQVKDDNGKILCAMSFGFHSAARAFATEISNLCTDSSSDVKYWHICKVMGRVASHLALEVALQTHANITLIGEDVAEYVDTERLAKAKTQGATDFDAYGMTLQGLIRMICDGIVKRAASGKNYGVMVVPEGILEFINEIQILIIKLNVIIAHYNEEHEKGFHAAFPSLSDKLSYLAELSSRSTKDASYTIWNPRDNKRFCSISPFFQDGLLTERDSHGNFQFSQVETERVVLDMIKEELARLKKKGVYRLGLERSYFCQTLKENNLDPEAFGTALFKDYSAPVVVMKETITSEDTLRKALEGAGLLPAGGQIPGTVQKIYKKSMPSFKSQLHFYGYDGRGTEPTKFDCIYTYNLGWTVFSLAANGATGQMAAIKNLEKEFSQWQPIGIPIAPLMRVEERKGKLALVLEKSVVNLEAPAFMVSKACREAWLAATPGRDNYRRPGPIRFSGETEEDKPITLELNSISCCK